MNLSDICVILVLGFCVFLGWKRGFVLTLFSFCSKLLSLLLTWKVYPIVKGFLSGTELFYNFIYKTVASGLKLEALVEAESMKAQTELISALHLPDFIIDKLHTGNNPVLYTLFKATNITEYIYAYLTDICMDLLALVLTFLVISLLLRFILQGLNLFTRIPGIHAVNSLAGAVVGGAQGVVIIWLAAAVAVIIIATGLAPALGGIMRDSMFSALLIEHNIILKLLG